MGQPGLLQRIFLHQLCVWKRQQRSRQHPHGSPIATIPLIIRHLKGAVQHKGTNSFTTGISAVHRPRLQPGRKLLGNCFPRPPLIFRNGTGNAKSHFSIIRDLTWLQVQPAAADHLFKDAVLCGNLLGGHKLNRCTQGIANRHTDKGGAGMFFQVCWGNVQDHKKSISKECSRCVRCR